MKIIVKYKRYKGKAIIFNIIPKNIEGYLKKYVIEIIENLEINDNVIYEDEFMLRNEDVGSWFEVTKEINKPKTLIKSMKFLMFGDLLY